MSSNPTLDRFHAGCTVPGTTNVGVDGDTRHTGEGYHTWRKLLASLTDYSSGSPRARNASSRDQGGRDNCSAAVDRGGSVPAVQIMTGRLLAAIATPHGRYLLRGLREFNGYDGRILLNRDAVLGWTQNYTPDASHMTHVHLGWFRDACEDWAQVSDVLSVINGTADLDGATTQSGTATPITPPVQEDDDMPQMTLQPGESGSIPVPVYTSGADLWFSCVNLTGQKSTVYPDITIAGVDARVVIQNAAGGWESVPATSDIRVDGQNIAVPLGGAGVGIGTGKRAVVAQNFSEIPLTVFVGAHPA